MATLELTTMIGCPVMCTFCPQDPLRQKYNVNGSPTKYMTVRLLEEVLPKIPKHVRIDFSGMSEPWANPDCNQLLELTLRHGKRVAVYTTLYGMDQKIASDASNILKEYANSVEIICIHLPDKNGNMPGLKINEDYLHSLNVFTKLYQSKRISKFQFMTMDSDGLVSNELSTRFGKLSPFVGIDRAGSLPKTAIETKLKDQVVFHSNAVGKRIVCKSTPYYDHNVLLPNGDVVLCCMDYGLKNIIGNLVQNTYESLFESKELHYITRANRSRGSETSICHNCTNIIKLD